MRVSVAMATYDGGRFLAEQLASIAAQTRPPDELVVSDDGSTDDTPAVVRAFARTAPFPVRVLDKPERLGFADNFLFAAENCVGDAVAFSDQDDVWLSRKLEAGVMRIKADRSLLSMHQLTLTDERLNPLSRWDQGIAGDAFFEPLHLDPHADGWGNTMVFRRELVGLIPRQARPAQPWAARLMSHDTWVYTLAAALGRVSHLAEPLILYRQHGANTAGLDRGGPVRRVRAMCADPTPGFAQVEATDATLAELFSELARSGPDPWRDPAREAADRFAARRARLRDRIEAYNGRSPAQRAAAFRRALAIWDQDPAYAGRKGRVLVKDLMLGVTGVARRIGPLPGQTAARD